MGSTASSVLRFLGALYTGMWGFILLIKKKLCLLTKVTEYVPITCIKILSFFNPAMLQAFLITLWQWMPQFNYVSPKKKKICLQCHQLFSYVGIARKVKWQHPIDFCRNNLWPILLSAKPFKSFPSVFIWKSTHAFYHFYQLCQLLFFTLSSFGLCPDCRALVSLKAQDSTILIPRDQRDFWNILMPPFCLLTYFSTRSQSTGWC